MDSNTLANGTIGGVSVALIIGTAVGIYKLVNHTRCRSMCCKKEISMSIDIEQTTPKNEKETISNLSTTQNVPQTS